MKIALCIVTGLVGLVLFITLVGAFLPRFHRASRTVTLGRKPAEIYAVIRDFADLPSWRSGLTAVEILPPQAGKARFREQTRERPITYVVLEDRPPEKLVVKIADENLPFGGTWTYEISPEGNGSRIRMSEAGEIKNLFFRFMARFVFGYNGTLEAYLRDLGQRFGEPVTPVP